MSLSVEEEIGLEILKTHRAPLDLKMKTINGQLKALKAKTDKSQRIELGDEKKRYV